MTTKKKTDTKKNSIKISVFNNKGGVGKTTIIWNLATALGESGKKVLLIDFDPQCNLSIAVLGSDEFVNKLKTSKRRPHGETIKAFVAPFITQNKTTTPYIFSPKSSYCKNVNIVPGDFWLNNFADQLSVGTDVISGGGLIRFLIPSEIIDTLNQKGDYYDYVLIDIPPSFNSLVRSALYSSDYFIVPCTADKFSTYCVGLIGEMLPIFINDWEQGKKRHNQSNPYDTKINKHGHPKFGGWIFNGFDTRKQSNEVKLTAADAAHQASMKEAIINKLIPSLKTITTYDAILPDISTDSIIGIEDLNVLAPDSIQQNTSILHLSKVKPTRQNVGRSSWAKNQLDLIEKTSDRYFELANYIIDKFN